MNSTLEESETYMGLYVKKKKKILYDLTLYSPNQEVYFRYIKHLVGNSSFLYHKKSTMFKVFSGQKDQIYQIFYQKFLKAHPHPHQL